MSTLARDFGAECKGGRREWIRRHLGHWLLNNVKIRAHELACRCEACRGERRKARKEIRLAVQQDPGMLEWADWSQIRYRGEAIRAAACERAVAIAWGKGERRSR